MKTTSKVAMALVAGIGLTAVFGGAGEAQAQERQCAPADTVEEMLRERAGEQRAGSGPINENQDLELFRSDDGGFTFVTNGPAGRCLQSMGESLTTISESEVAFSLPEQELSPEQQSAFQRMAAASRGTCNSPQALFNVLSDRYQEEPLYAGRGADGAVYVLFDTPDGAEKPDGTESEDSWTLVKIQKDHPRMDLDGAYSACIGPTGQDWTDIEPDENEIVGPNLHVSAPAPR